MQTKLSKEATHKYFLLVRQEGNRSVKRQIEHYSLDMIIAIGYRVKSQAATRFRQWAAQQMHEYRRKEMLQYESDFDRAIKDLKSQAEITHLSSLCGINKMPSTHKAGRGLFI